MKKIFINDRNENIYKSKKLILDVFKGIRHAIYAIYFNPKSFYIAKQRAKN